MKTTQLKLSLENTCRIISWNPTSSQLETIADQLVKTKPANLNDVEIIVTNICPDSTFMILEGVDNSDLRTLLAIANQVANSKK